MTSQIHDSIWLQTQYDSGRTMEEIGNELGISRQRIHQIMERFGIVRRTDRRNQRRPVISPNDRYGSLTVIAEVEQKSGPRRFHTRCDCGTESIKNSATLRNGTTTRCSRYCPLTWQAKYPK